MRIPGVALRVLAACAALAFAGMPAGGRAQSGPPPPGAVGMDNGPAKPDTDPVVAEVEGQTIHLSEVGDAIRAMPGGGAGNSLETLYPVALRGAIEREALVVRAHAGGLAADPTVARHMREAANRVLEDAYLHQETAKRVTDQMLSARYDAEIKGKPGPEEVHGGVILVPTEAEAQDIIARLAAGGDFAALARQSSKDGTSVKGGDLGFVRRDALGPEVGAVLFALRPGEVTPFPVRTAVGWFVLRSEARRPGPTPTFVEVRNRLLAESERANVPAVVEAALNGLTVRAYDMTGH
ncbi:MAG: peptidylprolyl isomerase [Acetobacteraceae bacterium]|jgi:peptidyl-prolyl cis-trans isomerase C